MTGRRAAAGYGLAGAGGGAGGAGEPAATGGGAGWPGGAGPGGDPQARRARASHAVRMAVHTPGTAGAAEPGPGQRFGLAGSDESGLALSPDSDHDWVHSGLPPAWYSPISVSDSMPSDVMRPATVNTPSMPSTAV